MKRIKSIIFCLISFVFILQNSHAQNHVWAKPLLGDESSDGKAIIVDNATLDVYATGGFSGTVDFDPGPGVVSLTSQGSYDMYVLKLDANGNFLWVKQISGGNNIVSFGIQLDASGNIFTTGYFQGTADFDPGTGTSNLTAVLDDIFVLKMDANGNFQWVKQMGGNDYDWASSIVLDASGNIYTTGYFYGTADFDPGANLANRTSVGANDIFVSKLDANGNFIWAKQIGGTQSEAGLSIDVDNSGNVYTTGRFDGLVDFDPSNASYTLYSNNNYDIFISKLDANGDFVFAGQMGGASTDLGQSIKVNSTGGYLVLSGYYNNTADFDPGAGTNDLTAVSGSDAFVVKLDLSCNLIWVKSFGGNSFEAASSMCLDNNGNIYLAGYFDGTVDFDPGAGTFDLTAFSSYDVFVSKLDASGNFIWAYNLEGSTASDYANQILVDASSNVYTTGLFSGSVDFDFSANTANVTATGSTDIFIHKVSQNTTGMYENNSLGQLNSKVYPNPATNRLTIETSEEIVKIEIYNNVGQLVLINNQRQINIENLESGFYHLKVYSQNSFSNCNFIKN